MTATYRHDVGRDLATVLSLESPDAYRSLDFKAARRWAGVGRGHRACFSFAVKLPRDLEAAHALCNACHSIVLDVDVYAPKIRGEAETLRGKLELGLGLPPSRPTREHDPAEAAFLGAIAAEAADLANWSAYADWLQEQDCPDRQLRGRVIAGWLGPKAVKVKYGLPVLMRNDSEGRKARGEV